MDTQEFPINVIILENIEESREQLEEDFLDVLKGCRTEQDFRSLISMIIDETRTLTLREILVKDIQFKCSVLEATKEA